jgi:hypothetical protein
MAMSTRLGLVVWWWIFASIRTANSPTKHCSNGPWPLVAPIEKHYVPTAVPLAMMRKIEEF